MPEKNEKHLESVESVRWVKTEKVEELRRKRFVEKISFESGVEVMMMMCNVVVWDWQLDGMGITNETEKGMGIKSG